MRHLLGNVGDLIAAMPPAYFAMVMATGIVSLACHFLGLWFFATPLFWLNLIMYPVLLILLILRLIFYPRNLVADLTSHSRSVGFFTMIAGTCILGNQILIFWEAPQPAIGLWLLGLGFWLFFIYIVFTSIIIKAEKPSLPAGINGTWLVATVSTQSLAVLGSLLATHLPRHSEEILFFSLCLFLLGGMLYLLIIVMIFYRLTFFNLKPSAYDSTYWINGGAAAISTLAGATLLAQSQVSPVLTSIHAFLLSATLLFWAFATWWMPLLIILEIWRVLQGIKVCYDPSYWSLVFPLGMYTACTFLLSQIFHMGFLMEISVYFSYLAITAWTLTFLGLLKSLPRNLISWDNSFDH